ncbi:MAG: hypothetical protein DDT19_02395 [Syntrophomonadaceae bacterium]|nr:hypothetical protein [Bacillota bacterium]
MILYMKNGQKITWEREDFRGAALQGVNFNGADLRKADLQGANLCNCNLHEAKITFRERTVKILFEFESK